MKKAHRLEMVKTSRFAIAFFLVEDTLMVAKIKRLAFKLDVKATRFAMKTNKATRLGPTHGVKASRFANNSDAHRSSKR